MRTTPSSHHRARRVSLPVIIVLAVITSLTFGAAGTAASSSSLAVQETGGSGNTPLRVYYELPYEQGRPVVQDEEDILNAEVLAAVFEARRWPNFDPSRLADQVAAVEAAAIEAKAWPHLDPSSLADQVAAIEAAAIEAQAWPDSDTGDFEQLPISDRFPDFDLTGPCPPCSIP